jgi:hypothetical protein
MLNGNYKSSGYRNDYSAPLKRRNAQTSSFATLFNCAFYPRNWSFWQQEIGCAVVEEITALNIYQL